MKAGLCGIDQLILNIRRHDTPAYDKLYRLPKAIQNLGRSR